MARKRSNLLVLPNSSLNTKQGCRNKGGMGGMYPPNNLAVYPPIVWEWSTSAFPPIIWMGVHLSVNVGETVFYSCWRPFFLFFWSSPEFGEKKSSILDEDLSFFFWSSPEFGEKSVPFAFFWSSLSFHTWTKSWSRFISPPNVEISAKLG